MPIVTNAIPARIRSAGDNQQNVSLQGYPGTLSDCSVCHGYMPTGPGPHGIMNNTLQNVTIPQAQTSCYDATGFLTVAGEGTVFSVQNEGSASLIAGIRISLYPGTSAYPGSYLHGYISTNGQYCSTPAAPGPVAGSGNDNVSVKKDAPGFKVYPNPTTGTFFIEPSEGVFTEMITVEIFCADGLSLSLEKYRGIKIPEVHLEKYPSGVYFIRLVSGSKNETVKVVRNLIFGFIANDDGRGNPTRHPYSLKSASAGVEGAKSVMETGSAPGIISKSVSAGVTGANFTMLTLGSSSVSSNSATAGVTGASLPTKISGRTKMNSVPSAVVLLVNVGWCVPAARSIFAPAIRTMIVERMVVFMTLCFCNVFGFSCYGHETGKGGGCYRPLAGMPE
jgi:hypothetical protein